ncbi:MAG TPA: SCO family protein [Gemmatimonadales bacterium]
MILAITAGWWALALWPAGATSPAWLTLTREVCFGTAETGLPNAGGWLVLTGQPIGMLLVLFAGWGRDVRAGLRAMARRVSGQLSLGAAGALLVVGVAGVVVRVRVADARTFAPSAVLEIAGALNRLSEAPRPLALVGQSGDTISLERFRGRPVLVTFAYANCETVCPLIVADVLQARDRLTADDPAVLIVTLDPWRDTPSRLPSIAARWGLTGDAHVLSGTPEVVERTLNAWRVPRVRNQRTGALSHPTLVYVIGRDGRIAYVLDGTERIIRAAVEAL